jgi:rfaE bifunctional protein nucleotidyltransferase chain/domain
MSLPLHEKILSRPALLQRFARPRSESIVFTNGVFDLLHRGHVEYLFAARELGDRLVIGLNTDDSVRRLKGAGRPLTSEQDRAVVLSGLACVDAVAFFDEDTPRSLIAALLPDVLVKGGDYAADQIVGKAEVEDAGGKVIVLPYLEGRSTTAILQRAGRSK